MYGLYGLKYHTVEMLPCGTGRRTREDKATQPLDAGRLSFATYAGTILYTPTSHIGLYKKNQFLEKIETPDPAYADLFLVC